MTSTSSTYRAFQKVNTKTASQNTAPHAALNGRTPASILYPDRSLPFKYFLPFGCKATVFKGFAARKASKLDPRGRDGIYIGTAAPYGMQGYLVYVFPIILVIRVPGVRCRFVVISVRETKFSEDLKRAGDSTHA